MHDNNNHFPVLDELFGNLSNGIRIVCQCTLNKVIVVYIRAAWERRKSDGVSEVAEAGHDIVVD
jgi:hypothetical protein